MPNLLNNVIRRVREKFRPGQSLAAVAKSVGVSKEYLSKVERGTLGRPSEEVLEKLLKAYDCPRVVESVVRNIYQLAVSGEVPPDNTMESNRELLSIFEIELELF